MRNRFFARFDDLPTYATRICYAIFCADFLTMLLMNVGRMKTSWLPPLFFGIFFGTSILIVHCNLISSNNTGHASIHQQRILTLVAVTVALIAAGARFPYLLEGHLHHLVGPVVYDDTWHFQEINSLVHSIRYPAFCSLIPSRYFSLYYAPWMMIAAIYLALPVYGLTIKVAFAIGCAIYQLLFCLTLLHIGIARAHDRKHLYWATYLVGCWAGVESIFSVLYYFQHNPEWLLIPDTSMHFVSFFLGILWAPHHLSASVALILCWHLWDKSSEKNWRVVSGCCALIAYAFYSSIFVFIGALPLAIFYMFWIARKDYKYVFLVICVSGALIWPLLWIYLGKSQDIRFIFPYIAGIGSLFPYIATSQFQSMHPLLSSVLETFPGMVAGLVAFIAFIAVNFLVHTIAFIFRGKSLRWDSRIFASIAILFLVSTYFIGFPEGDNYASRGSVVPIIVLGWICAGILPGIRLRSWIALCLALSAFGLLHEGISTYKSALRIAQTPLGGEYGDFILHMNQDRKTRTASSNTISEALAGNPNLIYHIEKFVPGGKDHLVVADRQLECLGPRGPWKWQWIPNPSDK